MSPPQDSDFPGGLEISESTSEGMPCIFGSHSFVPIGWTGKKLTAVSRSSTDSDVISFAPQRRKLCHFNEGPRLEGILALGSWDVVIEVLHFGARRKPFRDIRDGSSKGEKNEISNLRTLNNSATQPFLFILEVCEAVIKMIITCRISSMRHVSRTHRELLLIGCLTVAILTQ